MPKVREAWLERDVGSIEYGETSHNLHVKERGMVHGGEDLKTQGMVIEEKRITSGWMARKYRVQSRLAFGDRAVLGNRNK